MPIYPVPEKGSEQEGQGSRSECFSSRDKCQVHPFSKLLSKSKKVKAESNFKWTKNKTSVTRRGEAV